MVENFIFNGKGGYTKIDNEGNETEGIHDGTEWLKTATTTRNSVSLLSGGIVEICYSASTPSNKLSGDPLTEGSSDDRSSVNANSDFNTYIKVKNNGVNGYSIKLFQNIS